MGSTIDATKLLRPGLLQGVSVLIAGADGPAAQAVRSACVELGATVANFSPPAADAPSAAGAPAVWQHTSADQPVDLLFVDGAAMFASAGARERAADGDGDGDGDGAGASGEAAGRTADRPAGASRAALLACLDGAWEATRAVANAAFIEPARPGRIVYLAPAPAAGALADSARAGLENLARTLSIEWSRYAITPVTIAPGSDTDGRELAALIAYLASPAGSYFSGCLFDLRGPT